VNGGAIRFCSYAAAGRSSCAGRTNASTRVQRRFAISLSGCPSVVGSQCDVGFENHKPGSNSESFVPAASRSSIRLPARTRCVSLHLVGVLHAHPASLRNCRLRACRVAPRGRCLPLVPMGNPSSFESPFEASGRPDLRFQRSPLEHDSRHRFTARSPLLPATKRPRPLAVPLRRLSADTRSARRGRAGKLAHDAGALPRKRTVRGSPPRADHVPPRTDRANPTCPRSLE
jgi:hypothetical protein